MMNLVTNARDAMPDGGRLTITTELVTLDQAFIRKQGYGQPGPYALISVSDTGLGMDGKDNPVLIAKPFTQTRLLHMVREILDESNDQVQESAPSCPEAFLRSNG